VLSEPADVGLKKKPQAVIIATGSEVQLALKAQRLLADKKIAVRVVSMPSTTTFDREDAKYKKAVLPAGLPARGRGNGRDRRLVEIRLRRRGGHRHLRRVGPAPVLFKHFGFTEENVADTVRAVLQRQR
jgi:transketolase